MKKRRPLRPVTGTSDLEGMRPITVRIPGAVKLTGMSRSRLYELIKEGKIEAIKDRGTTLITVESLERFIDQRRLEARDPAGMRTQT
ncbi:MAG: hypothetical protein BGN95_12125 [Sphingomonas sp. 66-10]|jgi:excisionase family DNA binding protein|nr:MAG: hypothetical protein BGN95_12125 [Sphingomonas sp. 66-10]